MLKTVVASIALSSSLFTHAAPPLRFPELNYDSRLNKYTDREFKELLRVARIACRP
jgi:hypothetical protein